jgi:hypothetical protein
VAETGQPYAYTGDDPVNATDPLGLCSTQGTFLVPGACDFTSKSWVAQTEGTLQSQKGGGFSLTNGLKAVDDFGAAVGNVVTSTVTLGHLHISAPYCGFGWASDVGTGFGFVALAALTGGAGGAADVLGGAETVEEAEATVEGVQSQAAASDGAESVTSDESESEGVSCGGQSFSPNTEVTLADGREIPISRVKVGDMVLATDTTTGITKAERVTALWVNHDTDLLDVTVESSIGTSTIDSTRHHLFWDLTTKTWTQAQQLTDGDSLETSPGATATVVNTTVIPGAAYMWDLTVDNDHDFYVAVGAGTQTAVLVHNCPTYRYDPAGDEDADEPTFEKMPQGDNTAANTTAKSAAQAAMKDTGQTLSRAEIHDVVSGQGLSGFRALYDAYVDYLNNR